MFNHKAYRILEPLFWFHSKASELTIGNKTDYPIEPVLSDPGVTPENCTIAN